MVKRRFLLTAFCLLFAILLASSCKNKGVEPRTLPATIELEAVEVGLTDIWLKVTLTDNQEPRVVEVKRDGLGIFSFSLGTSDTVLVDTGLVLNTTYQYEAIRIRPERNNDTAIISAATLDSTSHDFVWQTFTLGDGNSSVLNDVTIIDENNILAVGEIYLRDTTTGEIDPKRYNLARSDGTSWNIQRVPYFYQGQAFYNPILTVLAFSANDVWFAGNGVIHWNGTDYVPIEIPASVWGSYWITKIWGSSSNNLYIVGESGSIARFDGTSWQKLESGTTLPIQDIWGSRNMKTGAMEILAVASYKQEVPQAKKLFRIDGFSVSTVNDEGLPLALSAVWFVPSEKYFIGGDGLFTAKSIGSDWTKEKDIPPYYKECIRGLGLNDITWVGGLGFVSHYNGSSWKSYAGAEVPFIQGNYFSAALHPKLMVAVGGIVRGRAIVLVGKR